MLRVRKSGPSQPAVGSSDSVKVVAARDGHLEFVPPARPRKGDAEARAPHSAPTGIDAAEAALIAANRAKLAELHSQPASMVPDFPDALVTSLARRLPGLSQAMTLVALRDHGVLPDDAVLAGATSLAFVANWLADRGFGPDLSESGEAAPSFFYGDVVGLMSWLLLDWINRSLTAAVVDDTELEDALDRHYPRWSRTDFEWDIRRLARAPILNPLVVVPSGDPVDTALPRRPPIQPRPASTPSAGVPRPARAELRSTFPSPALDRRPVLNHARERRAQR